jgi:hypothetical protein
LADRNPVTAALAEAFLKNSLLEIADIHASLHNELGWRAFNAAEKPLQAVILSEDSMSFGSPLCMKMTERFPSLDKEGSGVVGCWPTTPCPLLLRRRGAIRMAVPHAVHGTQKA